MILKASKCIYFIFMKSSTSITMTILLNNFVC